MGHYPPPHLRAPRGPLLYAGGTPVEREEVTQLHRFKTPMNVAPEYNVRPVRLLLVTGPPCTCTHFS